MDKEQPVEQQNVSNNDINQPDYRPDSQVEASFVDEDLDGLDIPLPMQNSIQNAQFNIQNPVMPVKDMVKLEELHAGAIDRILTMGEKEQSFTHRIVESQHVDQIKITDRNIEISKEQNSFNFQKLYIITGLIVILIICATVLFAKGNNIGGWAFTTGFVVLACIFMLGYFPNSPFSIFGGKSKDSSDNS